MESFEQSPKFLYLGRCDVLPEPRGDGENVSPLPRARPAAWWSSNIEAYRKPLGLPAKAYLKAVREPQTFWISSKPPAKKYLAALMQGYGLSMREQLDYGRETKRKRLRGGLAAAVVK